MNLGLERDCYRTYAALGFCGRQLFDVVAHRLLLEEFAASPTGAILVESRQTGAVPDVVPPAVVRELATAAAEELRRLGLTHTLSHPARLLAELLRRSPRL